MTTRALVVVGVAGALLAAGCSSSGAGSGGRQAVIVVSAPLSTSPWIATAERNGAELAAAQVNADGGVTMGGARYDLRVEVRDNAGSAQAVVADARRAVAEHAVAMVIDGVGARAVADVTRPAELPVFVVFDGGASIIDPASRPTLFRMAPADEPMAVRLVDYLADRHPAMAVITDDSSYGTDGAAALRQAFVRDEIRVMQTSVVPASSSDVSTQVLAARRAQATTLVVWAAAPVVAATVQAARSAGWQVPIWAGPTGEDPLVRQRLAAHPQWLTGVGFVSFRITAEVGPKPFATFRSAYERKYGVDRIGVRQDGKTVVQPPDWAMYSYDTVKLVAAGLAKAGRPSALLDALNATTVITGANGDERGFTPTNHEGVSPDDMYFAVFKGFVFTPVTDDLLSTNLPSVRQTE